MKDKNSITGSPSGIIITDNISLSLPKKRAFVDYIPLFIIALLGCVGTVNSFVSMFKIDISYYSLNFYTIFFFLIFSAIFSNQKSISLPTIPIFLIYEFLLYRKWNKYLSGFMLVCNQVYNVIYPERGAYFKIDMAEVIPESDVKTFFVFSIFLLTAIICCLSIVWPDFYFGFIFTFPFLEIGLYYGKTPDLIPVFILVIYWLSLLALHHSGYYRSTKRNKTGFVRKHNSFFAKPAIKFRSAGQSGIVMIIISVTVISLSFIIINVSGYSRSRKINTIRSNVKTAVSEFSIDDIGGSLERLSASLGMNAFKSNSHRLGNFDSISYKGKTDLEVIADRNAFPTDNIYIKGYVGSVYNGRSWDSLDSKVYSSAKEIIDYSCPQDKLYKRYGMDSEWYSGVNINMTIKPSALNQKYIFTPYNSKLRLPEDKIEYVNDTLIDTENKKKYSFEVSPLQNFNELIASPAAENNGDYRKFVYDNYLDVPNNDDTIKLYDNFIKNNNYVNTIDQLTNIKNILSKNAEYTLSPGKTPNDRDFVSYFLMDNHKGYCVHFATAGILLARMSGIPARYAEGYVILQSDFNMDNFNDGEYRIKIEDKRAHAWAEIYVDGYGWVPYEFTPPSAAALNRDSTTETTDAATDTTRPSSSSTRKTTKISTTRARDTVSSETTLKNSSPTTKRNIKEVISDLSPEVKLSIAGALLLILTIAVILAVHALVTGKREKSFSTGSNSQNALNAYGYIIKLLEFCDIKNKNMQYLEFAGFAELSDKRIFKPGTFREITEIALEAGMRGQEITDEQSEKVIMFSQRTALTIFRKQNIFGKLYMKFIRNLC